MKREKYITLFISSEVENKNDTSIFVYKDQCKLPNQENFDNKNQNSLIFSDEGGVYYGHTEQSSRANNGYNWKNNMFGYVLYKDL